MSEDDERQAVFAARRDRDRDSRQADRDSGDDVAPDVAEEAEEEVAFEGNYRIPSRIYDRLYDYQRTGVKWLWELHNQKCGGIIGDEMARCPGSFCHFVKMSAQHETLPDACVDCIKT